MTHTEYPTFTPSYNTPLARWSVIVHLFKDINMTSAMRGPVTRVKLMAYRPQFSPTPNLMQPSRAWNVFDVSHMHRGLTIKVYVMLKNAVTINCQISASHHWLEVYFSLERPISTNECSECNEGHLNCRLELMMCLMIVISVNYLKALIFDRWSNVGSIIWLNDGR